MAKNTYQRYLDIIAERENSRKKEEVAEVFEGEEEEEKEEEEDAEESNKKLLNRKTGFKKGFEK